MYSVLIQICRCYSAKTVVLEHQRSMNFIEKKTYMNPVYQLYIERNYFCGAN